MGYHGKPTQSTDFYPKKSNFFQLETNLTSINLLVLFLVGVGVYVQICLQNFGHSRSQIIKSLFYPHLDGGRGQNGPSAGFAL